MIGFQNRLCKRLLSWKIRVLESFEDCRELKELAVELLEKKGGKSV